VVAVAAVVVVASAAAAAVVAIATAAVVVAVAGNQRTVCSPNADQENPAVCKRCGVFCFK
jgi:hypothetical protein